MPDTDIRHQIRQVVLDAAPIKLADRAGMTLGGDLGYDSLGREELVALLEDEFPALRMPDEAFDVETVEDVETLVLRLLGVAA